MQYCPKCRMKIAGNRDTCPLCQGILENNGEKSEENFPYIKQNNKMKYRFVVKLLLLISIIIIIVSGTVNLMLSNTGHWALYVISGIACIWFVSTIILMQMKNILKTILSQAVVAVVIAVIWDFAMGRHGWSLDFVLPAVTFMATLTTAILIKALRMNVEDYSVYLCSLTIFNLVPVILLICKSVLPIPSLISVSANVMIVLVFFTFEGERVLNDLKRRLHI